MQRIFIPFQDGLYWFPIYEKGEEMTVFFGADYANVYFKDKADENLFLDCIKQYEKMKIINEGMKRIHELYKKI